MMRQAVKKPSPIPNGTPFYDLPLHMAVGTTAASILLHFLSFCSPYWLEAYPDTRSTFLRVGLWSVCFDKFVHPKDNFGTEWTGCYWIFNWNLWNRGLWEWIDPPWFISVQVMCGLAFICHCVSLVCMTFHFLLIGNRHAESSICLGTQAAAAVLLFVSVIVFGIKVDDRSWMPRPDHNHLSWSYAFAVLSCFISFISCIFLYFVSYSDEQVEHRRYTASIGGGTGDAYAYGQAPNRPPTMSAAGSVYAAGTSRQQQQQPYTMSMLSGNTQQQQQHQPLQQYGNPHMSVHSGYGGQQQQPYGYRGY